MCAYKGWNMILNENHNPGADLNLPLPPFCRLPDDSVLL